jgi:hypothetical protein
MGRKMNKIEQIFEDLKAELVSLVGDLSGVHNAVDNAKVALSPHLTATGEIKDVGTDDENKGANTDTP